MAEDWSVSSDGLTYTYKLRKDAKWFTADGEEYAPVKAQDFVTGIKYAVDNKSQAIDLIQNSIKGLNDYITGADSDFSKVGVKQSTTRPLNILWHAQNLTGTQKQPTVFFSR